MGRDDPRAIERVVDAVVVRLANRGAGYPARAFIRVVLEQIDLPTWVSPAFVADLVEAGFSICEEVNRDR